MAKFLSDIITALASISVSSKQVLGDRTSGVPLVASPIVTLKTAMAANDTLDLFDLPIGAVIIPQLCSAACLDPGTTLTLHVGDAGDIDRYANGIVLSNGGDISFTSGTMPAGVIAPFKPTSRTRIYATVASAAGLTNDVLLVFTIAYRIIG